MSTPVIATSTAADWTRRMVAPRVAIVGCFAQTAAGQRANLITKALQQAGAEVSVTPLDPPPGAWPAANASPRVERSRFGLGNRLVRRARAFQDGVKSLEQAVHAGADVIFNYSESWMYSLPVWKIARRRQIRLVQDCVEWYEAVCFGGNGLHPLLLDHSRKRKCLAARADGVTVITSRLESLYAARGAPTFLLPALCDRVEFEDANIRTVSRHQRDTLEVVVVVSGKPADGDELIRPILETARNRGVRFGVTVIGSGDPFDGRRCIGETSESGEYKIVRLAGLSRRDYLRTLAAADVFLLPRNRSLSSEAAFPNRVPEFMASGGVLVTTGVGDLPRYIRHGSSGLVCGPGDVSGFASAVSWISLNRREAAEIGENGRRLALAQFDYRSHGQPLLTFLLGRSGSAKNPGQAQPPL